MPPPEFKFKKGDVVTVTSTFTPNLDFLIGETAIVTGTHLSHALDKIYVSLHFPTYPKKIHIVFDQKRVMKKPKYSLTLKRREKVCPSSSQ